MVLNPHVIQGISEKCTMPAHNMKGPRVQWVLNSFGEPDEFRLLLGPLTIFSIMAGGFTLVTSKLDQFTGLNLRRASLSNR